MSAWPAPNDYTDAKLAFRDQELQQSAVQKSLLRRGMPIVWAGNFAQVYELRNARSRWAVKCFTRSSSDLQRRYATIAESITKVNVPYFVEFRFLSDEMLVNGKRYPIVKMAWVEGQSLDRYVETNLHRPQLLLQLAAQLVKMVTDLEKSGIAHGDLQHGNILIGPDGLKLVDYDGLFVPTFAGSRAPERGLPSYQHPRRDDTVYGPTLDRFALLVICTGLCGLALDPSLWWEFNTGENFLFRKEDFENPHASSLFRRLATIPDEQAQAFADLLRSACTRPPSNIPFPEKPVSTSRIGLPPWMRGPVTTEVSSRGPGASVQGAGTAVSAQLGNHTSFALCTTWIVGLALLYVFGAISGGPFVYGSILGAAFYLLERYSRFSSLPVFVRRTQLITNIQALRQQLAANASNQDKLRNQMTQLSQREVAEKTCALKTLQEEQLSTALSRIDVDSLSELRGIGPWIIGNLRILGIHNADQLRKRGLYGIPGIGSRRAAHILELLERWEEEASRYIARSLPANVEAAIASKYTPQKQSIGNQLTAVAQRNTLLTAQLSQSEWELKQMILPRFGHFIRDNF